MSSLSAIVAIFFAFLLTAPCSDVSSVSAGDQNTEQQHKNSDENHADNCAPFCTCNCCGAQFNVATTKMLSLQKEAPHYFKKIISYHSLYQPGIFSGIWQPPKIG